MIIENFNPYSFNWSEINSDKVNGESGFTIIKTQIIGSIKIRMVEYSNNYCADHWCNKGHIVYVLQGQLIIEHKDNSVYTINSGMTYLVGDDSMPHKAKTIDNATVLIID